MMANLVVVIQRFGNCFNAQISTLSVHGLNNTVDESKEPHFKRCWMKRWRSPTGKTEDPFRNNPVVAQWRDAYTKFKKAGRSFIN